MAKHMVKCFYCKKTFDANIEPYIKPNDRRYAHKECAEKAEKDKKQEEKDREQLEGYIKQLFNIEELTPKIKSQIKTYKEKGYSYSGMLKTLKFFYEVKKNSIDKSEGGIGIIPWVYRDAFLYWKGIYEAKKRNENLRIDDFILPDKKICILPPKREPMRLTRKLFTFLDEEVDKE